MIIHSKWKRFCW